MSQTLQRASKTKIISITDQNNNPLDIPTCIKNWENAATTTQHYAKTILKHRHKEIQQYLQNLPPQQQKYTKPHVLGRTIQTDSRNIDGVHNARTPQYTKYRMYSRMDEIIRAQVITTTRATLTRKNNYIQHINAQIHGTPTPKLSAGNARTLRPNPTTPGKVLDINYTDAQYSKITNQTRKTITYKIICGKEYVNLTLAIPKHLKNANKITQPKFVWDTKTNEFNIILTATYTKPKHKLSNKYIIGIDVGIKNYVTYAVYDIQNATTIETGTLSNYLDQELYTSINKTKNQIKNLWLKIETIKNNPEYDWLGRIKETQYQEIERLYNDIKDQRLSLSRKRKRMAIEAALEIKNLSIKYGNAVVARENLSWVGNTMQNGRWNCGEFFTRLEEVLEKDGGLSMWVSAYYTTKSCSSCGNANKKVLKDGDKQFHFDTPNRVVHCDACGFEADRDVNAAVNIAKRASCSEFFVDKVASLSSSSSQSNARIFERGRSLKWHRDRQKKRDRSKYSATPKREEQVRARRLEVVPVARVPLSLLRRDREVRERCFRLVYPLQFNSLPGMEYSIGTTVLVLSQEQKERFRQNVRKVLQK